MDPMSMINTQMSAFTAAVNQQMNEVFANVNGFMTQGLNNINNIAPHNVLPNAMKGSGTFDAKTATQELNRRNIFG